ncbi:hypothetical protein [Sporosarcina obsidiansis]|uniref:hypothetical protein n=1 Tax=Sporosarcina obsidiansis TaxID=2660748 RepID=UPI00129AB203|nr:hypothetical protein [Sporosarcina obsidiansis]
MTNYEQMIEAYGKLGEIRERTTTVARDIQLKVKAETGAIRADQHLTPSGKQAKINEVKQKYGREFIATAKQMREDYDRSTVKAKVSAEVLLNEEARKPSDIAVRTFQRELADLKTELLLTSNALDAYTLVDSFVSAQKEPYLAQQLKQQAPEFISQIVGLAGTEASAYRTKLRQTMDALNEKATTPEQREAAEIFESVEGRFGEDIFLRQGIQMNAIRDAVGVEFANFANNPKSYVDSE